jgi:hypothetical protein
VAASGGRSSKSGGGGWLHGAEAMGSSGECGEMGKKRERRTAMLKKGERGPDVAGSGGIRRPTWGSGEEREAGFVFRIPAISGTGASGRERGMGAGDAAHARAWSTWPGEGGVVGVAMVAGAAARAGEAGGGRWVRQVGPTCRRPREGGRRAAGTRGGPRPAAGPAERRGKKRGNGPTAHLTKRRKKRGKRKRKRKKDFPWNLKLHFGDF